jgi:hypothetical protein
VPFLPAESHVLALSGEKQKLLISIQGETMLEDVFWIHPVGVWLNYAIKHIGAKMVLAEGESLLVVTLEVLDEIFSVGVEKPHLLPHLVQGLDLPELPHDWDDDWLKFVHDQLKRLAEEAREEENWRFLNDLEHQMDKAYR